MQHALKQPLSRSHDHTSDRVIKTPKVLFVAPSSNGQLQIAKYFWSFYRPENVHAEFAALENNSINPWLNKAMHDYGFQIEQKQIESVFILSTTCKDFEHIVSIGGHQSYSNISPFMETLQILFGKKPNQYYWDIPECDMSSGNSQTDYMNALEIRDRIEFEIAQFSQSLR